MKPVFIILFNIIIFMISFPIYSLDIYLNQVKLELNLTKEKNILLLLQFDNRENIEMVRQSLLTISREDLSEYFKINYEKKQEYFLFPHKTFSEGFKRKSIELLFPMDSFSNEGWVHYVRDPDYEDIYSISTWFTGTPDYFQRILRYNNLRDREVKPEQPIIIPVEILLPVFRGKTYDMPHLITLRSYQGSEQDRALLSYGRDEQGEYALYRLRKGEALYSAVVVRFTGMTHAEDVLSIADIVAQRSGIKDVSDIPIGYNIKVPIEYLLPEFMPESSYERRQYLRYQSEVLRYSRDIKASGLENVHIILDPGHGGIDPGAVVGDISEHEIVYDIMCRLKAILETKTHATVHPTLMDRTRKFNISNTRNMMHDRNEILLTTPNYDLRNSTVGVNLRWYLSNYIFENLMRHKVPRENIVFISIHADHLFATLSGAMIYVADSQYLTHKSYGMSGNIYENFREFNYKPRYSFTRQNNLKSQALSQNLAKEVLLSFERNNIAIYPNVPLRGYIIRGRRRYVPAVLRYNIVPTKLLLEVGNLNNPTDRNNMLDHRFRQNIAEAILEGLLQYYNK